MKRIPSSSTRLHPTPRPRMPAEFRLPFCWLIPALFVLSLLLSTLLAAEPDTACIPHDLTRAVRALSRTAAAVLEGRPAADPSDACPRTFLRPVRDALTPNP